jgi:hypothetical protein
MTLKDFTSKIDGITHTFVGYIGKAASWFGKHEPQIDDAFMAALAYATPLITDVLDLELGPEAGPAAIVALKAVATELQAVKSVVYDFGVSGGVVSKLQALQSDMSSVLMAGYIKNADSQAKFSRIFTEIGALVAAGLKFLQPATA